MSHQILSFYIPETQTDLPTVIDTITFIDICTGILFCADVYDGYVTQGQGFLVLQPTAQEFAGEWLTIPREDNAFPVNVETMRDIKQVQP